MDRPKNYDNIVTGGDFTPVTPGGHKCKIMQVQEQMSKNGLKMLVVAIDMTGDDPQANYYTNAYRADKASGKEGDALKWKGKMYVVVDEGTNYGPANLKRLVTAAEDSNQGFRVTWGEHFCACLKDRKVGVVFREEEYIKKDGGIGTSVKPFRFCAYDKAGDQAVPKKKAVSKEASMSITEAAQEGFMTVDNLDDPGLPFA